MIITHIIPKDDFTLHVTSEDARSGLFNITHYLESEVFLPLKELKNFKKVKNGKYFIEWDCGADLSADTIEARWQLIK
ncbi:MAG: DUF2442 domain-containing protein [Pseudomonadota bacterium]